MNRKLIRTTLAEVKEREMQAQQQRRVVEPPVPRQPIEERIERVERPERVERTERVERAERPERVERTERLERTERDKDRDRSEGRSTDRSSSAAQPKKKIPPEQTNAESFYYKKQMDAHTPMIIVLQDNENLNGTIEWYDKNSIKLHRPDGPNLLILKHNIKYLYKDQPDED